MAVPVDRATDRTANGLSRHFAYSRHQKLSRRCHTTGETPEDTLRQLWTVIPRRSPSLRQQATHWDTPTRTVNPSAYAYAGSNPAPATKRKRWQRRYQRTIVRLGGPFGPSSVRSQSAADSAPVLSASATRSRSPGYLSPAVFAGHGSLARWDRGLRPIL